MTAKTKTRSRNSSRLVACRSCLRSLRDRRYRWVRSQISNAAAHSCSYGTSRPNSSARSSRSSPNACVEVGRDRRLDEARADGCLIGEPAHLGESSRHLGASASSNSSASVATSSHVTRRPRRACCDELEPAGVGVQRVRHEVAAQPGAGCATTEALDRRPARDAPGDARRARARTACVVGVVVDRRRRPRRGACLQAIGESLGELVALGRGHNSGSGTVKRQPRRWINS